jgi:lon-related putative ATP-dependent protease
MTEPLPLNELFHPCGDDDIAVDSSLELERIEGVIGQERAISALEFAMAMDLDGHNVFVLGPPGTGRHNFVQQMLQRVADGRETPSDWCYVNNFDDSHCPNALELPAGMGKKFALDMDEFIEEVRTTLSAAFEGEDYRTRLHAIELEFQSHQNEALEAVHKEARRRDIRIMQSPSGMIFAPVRDGEALGPDEFEKLPEEDQKAIQKTVEEITQKLQKAMEGMPRQMREARARVAELENEVTRFAVGSLVEELRHRYAAYPRLLDFLGAVEQDVIANSRMLRMSPDNQHPMALLPDDFAQRRYAVNVFISREPGSPPPVVREEHPAYAHLVGRVEHRAHMGTLSTDFTLIRAGALHHANGGYLVLDAARVLTEPFAWQGLKQALESGVVKIESIAEAYALSGTVALEPEPIPLKLKVILIGDRRLFYLLQSLDPEFRDLFKIAADFDDRMDRTTGSQLSLAGVMANIVNRDHLLPLNRGAMYRLIEEAARAAGDRGKLSTEIRLTEDLLREGHYHATRKHGSEISAADIDTAIAARESRNGRLRERITEEIVTGNVLIDTDGGKVGHVNGLAVLQLGDYAFGRPSRITARVALGTGKVIDIEREAELGGSLHSKGVLILAGYIAARYGTRDPLSLSATIAFEQSYGGVDGDSASSAELYALLSAVAEIPIAQSFAVTGSVNQYGDVQAIGGANEKIEGFFDVCAERGLTGRQGVMIPSANVKHLMLRRRVIDAVAAGNFRIYAVDNIDEGLSILTGLPSGVADSEGRYPEGSLNRRISDALGKMAAQRRSFSRRDTRGNDQ